MLFDAGPSGELWARNVSQMQALGTVVKPEAFVLSHWCAQCSCEQCSCVGTVQTPKL